MKNLMLLVFMGATLILSACQKKDDGGTFAQTPNSCNLNGSATCNSGYYTQNGWQTYNTAYGYNNGSLCGCPVGYVPVNNGAWGLGCAPAGYFSTGYAYYGWNYNPYYQNTYQQYEWRNIPQLSYANPYQVGNLNCATQAYQACDVRATNACPVGYVCSASAYNSTIGVCRSTYTGSVQAR